MKCCHKNDSCRRKKRHCHHNNSGWLRIYKQNVFLRQRIHFLRVWMEKEALDNESSLSVMTFERSAFENLPKNTRQARLFFLAYTGQPLQWYVRGHQFTTWTMGGGGLEIYYGRSRGAGGQKVSKILSCSKWMPPKSVYYAARCQQENFQ